MTEQNRAADPSSSPRGGGKVGGASTVRGLEADLIQVFIGTKAQYIKTAPLLRLMDDRGVEYRLIDSGQHAALSVGLREELGVREPDVVMGSDVDITSIPQAALWAGKLSLEMFDGDALRQDVFGGRGGICVVHGDTPSTLLSALMAKRAGLQVAHLEAGLRSHHLFHPFPEEIIRLVVMRVSDVLFAPDAEAVRNLRSMRVPGEVVRVSANTVVESLAHDLKDAGPAGSGPAVVTMHRVENLNRRQRVERFVATACRIAAERPVRFVVHGPTEETLRKFGMLDRLDKAGVEIVKLVPHGEFVGMLHEAPLVITDGGSIQEECALLGVPTLLWREHSERPDGIGRNVVVSRYDDRVITDFLADPEAHRVDPATEKHTPSAEILERLLARL